MSQSRAKARATGTAAVAGSKRKRGAAATSGGVDIDLSAEDEVVQRPVTRRRGGGISSVPGAPRTDPGEVIVIED